MKLRTGEPTEKEVITAIAQNAYNKALSLDGFIHQIKAQGYDVYFRNGIPSGIVGKRRYRFTSLEITLEKLARASNRESKNYKEKGR